MLYLLHNVCITNKSKLKNWIKSYWKYDVLIFAQFNTIFTSYELKLTSAPSCDSDSLSNALVLYLSIGAGCLIAGFIAFTLINKRYENKLLNK